MQTQQTSFESLLVKLYIDIDNMREVEIVIVKPVPLSTFPILLQCLP